jgi:MEMO1 family protein
MLRRPAVADHFYEAAPGKLKDQVARFIVPGMEKFAAKAVIVPHAGLIYSGEVAGRVYSSVALPATMILLGPHHAGSGESFSVFPEGDWLMPWGGIPVNRPLAERILAQCAAARPDVIAHQSEHSLEVQLPLLQALIKSFSIVPIIMAHSRLSVCRDFGENLAAVIRDWQEPVLLICTTDLTHYESESRARQQDKMVIEKILDLDPAGLYTTVHAHHISMCGCAATVTALFAALKLNATNARLIHYMTSGDLNETHEQVVGYAGMIIQ